MEHDVGLANPVDQGYTVSFFYFAFFSAVRRLWDVVWEQLKWLANYIPSLRTPKRPDDQFLSLNSTDVDYSHGKENSKVSEHKKPSIVSGSERDQPGQDQAIEQHQLPTVHPDSINDHLFALIIGIDNYQDEKIRKLKGCVNDSENVYTFLTETLHANPAHIKYLRDAQATRQNILYAFEEHLINNQEIQQNDAIVFYFAGHGSYEISEENYLAGNHIETICPYDDRMGARGIPDRTFASLMRRLAVLRGNNITAIFDSCHSGGMGRIPDSDLENSRFIAPPESSYPTGLDDDIWNTDPTLSTEIDDPYTPYPPLTSHVLLAACQHNELAYEACLSTAGHHAGAFTSLLLDILRQPGRNITETTYIGLFHTLEQPENKLRLPKQTPYVEGDNKTRILFSMTDLGRHFLVSLRDDGTFSVAAGTIHGVDAETEFTITSGKERLQGLKPFQVSPLRCAFKKPDNMTLQGYSRAQVTKWNQLHPKVFFQLTHDRPSDSQDYDIVISQSPKGRTQLDRRDGLIPRYAEKVILLTPQDAQADLSTPNAETSAIIAAVTHFNFHLLRESRFNIIGEKLMVKLERLSPLPGQWHGLNTKISYFPASNGENFFISGEQLMPRANIKKGPKVSAAVKLPDLNHYFSFTLSVRDVRAPLFPYVFGFDPSTYEIASFYHPEPTKEGPLSENQAVMIGYGPEGGDPIEFYPNEVTFFKIFVTSTYVDLKGLVQQSPFSRGVSRIPTRPSRISHDFWESWVYVVRS